MRAAANPQWKKITAAWWVLTDGPEQAGQVHQVRDCWIGIIWESRYLTVRSTKTAAMRAVRRKMVKDARVLLDGEG